MAPRAAGLGRERKLEGQGCRRAQGSPGGPRGRASDPGSSHTHSCVTLASISSSAF